MLVHIFILVGPISSSGLGLGLTFSSANQADFILGYKFLFQCYLYILFNLSTYLAKGKKRERNIMNINKTK